MNFSDFWRHVPEMIAALTICGIPIVAILTSHQRKMAEIIHGKNGAKNNDATALNQAILAELQNLRVEVAQIRDSQNQRSIEHDSSLSQRVGGPPQLPR